MKYNPLPSLGKGVSAIKKYFSEGYVEREVRNGRLNVPQNTPCCSSIDDTVEGPARGVQEEIFALANHILQVDETKPFPDLLGAKNLFQNHGMVVPQEYTFDLFQEAVFFPELMKYAEMVSRPDGYTVTLLGDVKTSVKIDYDAAEGNISVTPTIDGQPLSVLTHCPDTVTAPTLREALIFCKVAMVSKDPMNIQLVYNNFQARANQEQADQ
ncbi:MAG: hypothetical protein ABIH34_06680 [Nanoarchaeota archaeon]